MGRADHRGERLRRQAEEVLAAYDGLPAWKRQVLARFLVESRRGWHTLVHSRFPNTPPGQPDALVIGPLGVLAVLLREEEPVDVNKVSRSAGELLLGARVRERNVSEAVVRPVLVLPQERRSDVRSTGDHLAVHSGDLDRLVERGERRLDKRDAQALLDHLERIGSDYRQHVLTEEREETENAELFATEEVLRDRFDQALTGPFESWLTFLDDSQFAMVRRQYHGPARISGPAGTGKSVVAMHRLVHLAKRTTGPLLFSTYARNLPPIMRRGFERLAPELAERVEFRPLHAWARNLLQERGHPVEVDGKQITTCFSLAWSRLGRTSRLNELNPNANYWKDEIDRVIKGRGLGDLREYQQVQRTGRGMRLDRGRDREAMWELYQRYEEIRRDRGLHDFNDLLESAWTEVRTSPLDPPYAAVVVDEVQDITLVGLRLLRVLGGDGPNGLLLVGDGQQQIYAGGWRLSDADIPIRGRGEVLRINYRNASRVLEMAQRFDATNHVDDLDGGVGVSLRDAVATLRGGTTVSWRGLRTEHESALVSAVRELGEVPLDDVALLTFEAREVQRWLDVLRKAGFAARLLDGFEGERDGKIKVGTVYRAKGLEFRAVFVPELPPSEVRGRGQEWRERGQRAQLVAMTRARDHVWVGAPEG